MTVKDLGEGAAPGARLALDFAARADGTWIAGRRADALDGGRLAVEDPATEQQIAEVPCAGERTVDAAVGAASGPFGDGRWARLAPAERTWITLARADLVETHAPELAALEALDNGKAVKEARGDVGATVAVLRY